MAISSSGNSSLDKITNSYQSNDKDKTEREDALGRDTFLTMLVAQLQNQDPLNPMEGTDFSAQLAQFSQLEQLMNLNDSMESLAKAFSNNSEGDVTDLIGKQVTGNVDVMNVEDGTVSGGFYSLGGAAEVKIIITDESGNTVKTLDKGNQDEGSYMVAWDGTDANGDAVEDGTYKYTVMANTGSGYTEVPASLTGTVDGVAYNNGKAYLVVGGILMDSGSVTAIKNIDDPGGDGSPESILEYLGKTVTSYYPIVQVDDDGVSGGDLTFDLDEPEDVTITIYDGDNNPVRTITIPADETQAGANSIEWDGLVDASNGGSKQAGEGLYYYTVKGEESGLANTPVTEEVSGIKYMNGTQFLVLKDSGRLVSIQTITEIKT